MQGFKLTPEMEEQGFVGGSVRCSAMGHSFDVGEGLKQGDGVIYTDDDIFAEVLKRFPGLQPVPVEEIPDNAVPVETPGAVAMAPAQQLGPSTLQSGLGIPVTPVQEAASGPAMMQSGRPPVEATENELQADHRDELGEGSVDEAIAAGEAVSGLNREDDSSSK